MNATVPPPPYMAQPQQLPTPTPPPLQNSFAQVPSEKQVDLSYGQFPMQQQAYAQSPPAYPMQPTPHLPPQYPMNATQQQQIQHIVENIPPEKLQLLQQEAQQIMNQQQQPPMSPQSYHQPYQSPPQATPDQQQQMYYTTTSPTGLFGVQHTTHSSTDPPTPKDAQKTDKVKRFFGDTLFGRVARSSVQTVTSTMKMPNSLSPWGDNNPVTLPNVRYRDAVLFTTFAFVGAPIVDGISDGVTGAFGADSFISEIVSSGAGQIVGSTALKFAIFQVIEQAIDSGIIEHLLPEEEKLLATTDIKSLQVSVKHKLMGVDADLRFAGVYSARDPQACAKGWFCPYLFASARTPSIPRANDFAICQFFGPLLAGDYLLAHSLLSSSTHTMSLCDPNPETNIGTNRLLILFTAITPFRANMWSTSRRPGAATLSFHLPNGCPALVIPVTSQAPICAWSPWTLAQMRASQMQGAVRDPHGAIACGMYSPEWQHEQICEWLDTIISVEHVKESVREKYVQVLGRMVSIVLNGALALERCGGDILGKIDPERAGIVMFRY